MGVIVDMARTDGTELTPNIGMGNDQLTSFLHGPRYEQNFRGNLYSGGMSLTNINAATFTAGTLGATCTPVVGIWNQSSTINAVILETSLQVMITALQNTGAGPFVWATSTGNFGITTGNIPVNRKTLTAAGSLCKDMSGVALTGLTNSLQVRGVSGVGGGNVFAIATLDTAAGFSTLLQPSVDRVDGAWIIPPGGVLALLASTTPVAHSAASALLWEEVKISGYV